MTGFFLILSFVLAAVLFLNRKPGVRLGLLLVFSLALCLFSVYEFRNMGVLEWGFFRPDALGVLMLFVLSVVAIPAVVHSHIYLNDRGDNARISGIYCAALVLLVASIGAACLSDHIAVTWIFVELTTLCASALIYHHRNERSLEGTWKYVFLCAISVSFIFIGILFLSMALRQVGSTGLSYGNLMEKAPELNPFWLRLAFLFVFTGFTAKMGLVPMYTAGVDAKDKAPAPAGALFSSVLMNMGFVGIFRMYAVMTQTSLFPWARAILIVSAVLSVFVATVYMVKVTNMKRMLAYSSMEHMGLVLLALAIGGVGYYAALLHLVLHSFIKSALFFQFSQVYRVFRSKYLDWMGHYFKHHPSGALVLLTGFFCITAMPPSGLFMSELLLFKALFESHHIVLLILLLLLLSTIIWALGRNIFQMLFLPLKGFDASQVPRMHPAHTMTQWFLLVLSVILAFFPPDAFVSLIREAISILPHGL